MRCHENVGGVHEPRVVLGVLVHFGAWLLLFALGLTWALWVLLRPGKGIAPP